MAMNNNQNKFELDEATQAIANEMLDAARAERQARESARRFLRLIKLITTLLIIGFVTWLSLPWLSGIGPREKQRQDNLQSIVNQLQAYRTAHRGNLPSETSRRQWQREFIDVYVKDSSFTKDPLSGKDYQFEINRKKSLADLKQDLDFTTIHIDQSAICGKDGELIGAGNYSAALRLKLESGQIYCLDAN